MQHQKTMSTMVSSSPKVGTVGVRDVFRHFLKFSIYRCGGDDERMV